MGDFLEPCPCGKTPSKLHINDNGQGYKWADATGDCCGEWSVEFRTQYLAHEAPECMELAIEAWNRAPRKLALMTNRLNTADAKVRELEEAARAVVEAKQKSGPFTAPRELWVAIALLNNVLNQGDSSDE